MKIKADILHSAEKIHIMTQQGANIFYLPSP